MSKPTSNQNKRNLTEIYKQAVTEVQAGGSLKSVAQKYSLGSGELKVRVDDYSAYKGLHPAIIMLCEARAGV